MFKEIYEWAQAIAVAMVLALVINQFVFAMVQVEGSSMLPTLESKERLVVTKLFYKPKAKDIVVVKSHELGKHIIKRVIAVPGDVIDINGKTGDVSINGKVIDEPYILEKLRSAGNANAYPLTVPEDYVFVMGDNRNNSQDSRNLGLIAYEDVVGRASLRIMPFSKFGGLYDNLEE
ncbi:MAG: signal peptidase I [Clostridia bacterium]|nr:signal peptidase I [Clostridia bacterium]